MIDDKGDDESGVTTVDGLPQRYGWGPVRIRRVLERHHVRPFGVRRHAWTYPAGAARTAIEREQRRVETMLPRVTLRP